MRTYRVFLFIPIFFVTFAAKAGLDFPQIFKCELAERFNKARLVNLIIKAIEDKATCIRFEGYTYGLIPLASQFYGNENKDSSSITSASFEDLKKSIPQIQRLDRKGLYYDITIGQIFDRTNYRFLLLPAFEQAQFLKFFELVNFSKCIEKTRTALQADSLSKKVFVRRMLAGIIGNQVRASDFQTSMSYFKTVSNASSKKTGVSQMSLSNDSSTFVLHAEEYRQPEFMKEISNLPDKLESLRLSGKTPENCLNNLVGKRIRALNLEDARWLKLEVVTKIIGLQELVLPRVNHASLPMGGICELKLRKLHLPENSSVILRELQKIQHPGLLVDFSIGKSFFGSREDPKEFFQKLKKLKRLRLYCADDTILSAIKDLPIHELILAYPHAKKFDVLGTLKSLTSLTIVKGKQTNYFKTSPFACLKATKLKKLKIKGRFNEKYFEDLLTLSHLEEVNLNISSEGFEKAQDQSLELIAKLPLTKLYLSGFVYTREWDVLKTQEKLGKIYVENMTDSMLGAFGRLPNLRHIDIPYDNECHENRRMKVKNKILRRIYKKNDFPRLKFFCDRLLLEH